MQHVIWSHCCDVNLEGFVADGAVEGWEFKQTGAAYGVAAW